MTRWKPAANDLLVLLVVAFWAVNISLVKIALAEMPPLPYNAIRLLLASAILLGWLLASERSVRLKRRHLAKILLLSFSGYALYQYLFIVGIDRTTAANTAVIFGSGPIMISLLSSFFKQDRIRPLGWLGIALGFAGIYLVVSGRVGGISLSARTWKGDLILFAAVFLWSHYTVSARPLLKAYSPLRFTAVTMGLGTLMFLPPAVPPLLRFNWGAVSLKAWLCLAYSGAVALSLCMVLWFFSVRRVGNSRTAMIYNLQPAFAVVAAAAILGERLAPSLLLGAAVIFAGIALTRLGRSAPPPEADGLRRSGGAGPAGPGERQR
jgi:drug/metabolite transporter (DMT)-like permease